MIKIMPFPDIGVHHGLIEIGGVNVSALLCHHHLADHRWIANGGAQTQAGDTVLLKVIRWMTRPFDRSS